jgi:hypothetical protein
MQAAGVFMQMWGALESGRMARIQGERARLAAEFSAWQAEQEGGLAIAISQRQAEEERRKAGFLASRALAVAASSGAGVSDPTMIDILTKTRGEGAYRANVALYEGEARARQLRLDAAAGRLSGAQAAVEGAERQLGYGLGAVGTGVRGVASLYARYGQNGPGGRGDSALLDAGTPDFSSLA